MERTEQFKCLIWGTPAKLDDLNFVDGDVDCISSSRAGGIYLVPKNLENDFMELTLTPQNKAALSYWIRHQLKEFESDIPFVDEKLVNEFAHRTQKKVVERIDDAIIWFSNIQESLADWVEILHDGMVQTSDPRINIFFDFLASTSCLDSNDGQMLLQLLKEEKLIEHQNSVPNYRLTYKGWKRVGELSETLTLSTSVFVAMWFDDCMSDVYSNGIAAGIRKAGYEPIRIDNKEHNNKIDDEIISEIRRAKFLVADFTSELLRKDSLAGLGGDRVIARGGVYFEAGFAKGLGKEVIWTVREDVLPFVHFDTRQFAHIVWKDSADLCAKLEKRISATLGDGPLKK
jgi:hypothetical protein